MRYIDRSGFAGRLYYEFIVVDLWQSNNGEGNTTPIININLLTPNNGGFAVVFKTPWTSIGIGWCK